MESKPKYGVTPLACLGDIIERQILIKDMLSKRATVEMHIKADNKGEFQFQEIPVSDCELKLLETLAFDHEAICRAYGIPVQLLDTSEGGEHICH